MRGTGMHRQYNLTGAVLTRKSERIAELVAENKALRTKIERLKACIEDAYREGWQQAAGYSDVYLDDLLDEDWGNSNAALAGKEDK